MSGEWTRVISGVNKGQQEKWLKTGTNETLDEKSTIKMEIGNRLQTASNWKTDTDNEPEKIEVLIEHGRKDLPKEVWALVLGRLDELGDFARLQRVSNNFYSLVLNNCWTKVTKISIGERIYPEDREWVKVKVDIGVLEKKRQLPVDSAAFLLAKLVEKATKTTAFHLDFYSMERKRHEEILCGILDAAIPAKIKVEELVIKWLRPILVPVPQTLARFLTAIAKSLKHLTVETCFVGHDEAVPAELQEAFRSCRSLESTYTRDNYEPAAGLVAASILHQIPHLKSFGWADGYDPSILLDSGTKLRRFCCSDCFLVRYLARVQGQNLSLDHPLLSLEQLVLDDNVDNMIHMIPWEPLPNLKLLDCTDYYTIYKNQLLELIRSFLTFWAPRGEERTLECRVNEIWKGEDDVSVDVDAMAEKVVAACGCHVTVAHNSLVCQKRNATFKVVVVGEPQVSSC